MSVPIQSAVRRLASRMTRETYRTIERIEQATESGVDANGTYATTLSGGATFDCDGVADARFDESQSGVYSGQTVLPEPAELTFSESFSISSSSHYESGFNSANGRTSWMSSWALTVQRTERTTAGGGLGVETYSYSTSYEVSSSTSGETPDEELPEEGVWWLPVYHVVAVLETMAEAYATTVSGDAMAWIYDTTEVVVDGESEPTTTRMEVTTTMHQLLEPLSDDEGAVLPEWPHWRTLELEAAEVVTADVESRWCQVAYQGGVQAALPCHELRTLMAPLSGVMAVSELGAAAQVWRPLVIETTVQDGVEGPYWASDADTEEEAPEGYSVSWTRAYEFVSETTYNGLGVQVVLAAPQIFIMQDGESVVGGGYGDEGQPNTIHYPAGVYEVTYVQDGMSWSEVMTQNEDATVVVGRGIDLAARAVLAVRPTTYTVNDPWFVTELDCCTPNMG